ncbi:MAG: toxic anion resistance protein [Herpetosiphonaceae bacterium]|nr:toxic anion resistance protein [Herpetosiphonaceae bacterium]
MTTSSGNLQVQFPRPVGVSTQLIVPPSPEGQANEYMMQLAGSQATRQQLICKDLLTGQSLANAQQLAAELYPQMLANTQIFMEFGKDAIAGMNSLIDQLLREVTPVDIPELTALMRDLNNEMRKIRGKYDISDPQTREKLEKWAQGVRGWFGRHKSLLEALMEDAMSLEQQLDRATSRLAGKAQQLVRNVHMYDQLYTTNEQEIMNVIGTIGVMELIRDMATRDVATITVDPNNPGDRLRSERKRLIAEFVNNMEIKIAEYKNRLFVGWTTSPQVTNMRTLDIGLAQKLDLLINLTIPVMKGTILQWRMMIQSQQGAMMEKVVAEAANEWLTAYANAGAQAVPLIAEAVQTPSLTPQTIAAMAGAVEQQAQGIMDAYATGKQRRAEVDDAIVTAQRVIQNATERVSDNVVNDLVSNATRRLETT